jgi:hypothetical protein
MMLTVGTKGKLTLSGLLGINHWVGLVPLTVLGVGALVWLDRLGL